MDRRWLNRSTMTDLQVMEILRPLCDFVCPEMDRMINALANCHTPEADLFVVSLEEMRARTDVLREAVVELADLAAKRKKEFAIIRIDETSSDVYDRRNANEKRRRKRLSMLPKDHPAAPINWKSR